MEMNGGGDIDVVVLEDVSSGFDGHIIECKTRKEVAELKLPQEALTQQKVITCVPLSQDRPVISDPTGLDTIPILSDIRLMISQLDMLPARSFGIETDNGCILTLEALKNIQSMQNNIVIKRQVSEENRWLEKVEKGYNHPLEQNIVNNDLRTVALDFVSALHNNCDSAEVPDLKLPIDTLKQLIPGRWITDTYVSWIISKLNEQVTDTFAFSYSEVVTEGGVLREQCIKHFQRKFEKHISPQTLIIFLNVGKVPSVIGEARAGKTFVGMYTDMSGNIILPCHYALLVYNFETGISLYCDSLGWSKPVELEQNLGQFVTILTTKLTKHVHIRDCHYNKNSHYSSKHRCIKGKCAQSFPLQTCGFICGVSAIICGVIAALNFDMFYALCSITDSILVSKVVYLKNISRYRDFLGLVLMKWTLSQKINVEDIYSTLSSNSDKVHSKDYINAKIHKTASLKSDLNLPQRIDEVKKSNKPEFIEKESAYVKSKSDCFSDSEKEVSESKTKSNEVVIKTSKKKVPHNNNRSSSLQQRTDCDVFHLKEAAFSDKSLAYAMLIRPCEENDMHLCSMDGQHLHCRLCNEKTFNNKSLRRHIRQVHLNIMHCVKVGDTYCLPCCKKEHVDSTCKRLVYHYHCLYCTSIILQKKSYMKHLAMHDARNFKPPAVENADVPSCSMAEELSEEHLVNRLKVKREVMQTSACPICQKVMRNDCLNRHFKTRHSKTRTPQSVCVDKLNAIYMVPKNVTGVMYPIHVQKLLQSPTPKVFCEEASCSDLMKVCEHSGIRNVMCAHLNKVNLSDTFFPEDVVLDEEILYSLGCENDDGEKILNSSTIQQCIELNNLAISNDISPVVVFDNNRYTHLSIYSNKVHYNAKLKRYVVTCDNNSGSLDCGCCIRKVNCVHKSMALWLMKQTDRLPSINDTNRLEPSFDGKQSETADLNVPSFLYPPVDQSSLESMIRYIHKKKKYDGHQLQHFRIFNKSLLPGKFVPIETMCHLCKQRLSKSILVSKQVKVFTLQGLLDGYESYVKKCNGCSIYYRYQEYTHGVHNFDDHLFMGLDVCMYLREHVQQHNSIGSFVDSMNQLHNCNLNHQSILNSYLLFDVLSTLSYDFYCTLCGHHPWLLVMDLNKKIAFRCDASTIEDVDEDDPNAEIVDADSFWEKVEQNIVSHAFPSRKVAAFDVQLSFKKWAPFMGRYTRNSFNMLNTEYKKINRDTGEFESDAKDMTEERILEMLSSDSFRKVKTYAKTCNVSTKGNKLDIIMRIKSAITRDDEKFKKLFSKMWGHSGGWLTFSCPHGIVYYLKFILRSESCRDYVDGLISMKILPNVVIVDMAHIVARHANGRCRREDALKYGKGNDEGFIFYPYEGRVADVDDPDNVARAREDELQVSFPWMEGCTVVPENEAFEGEPHPITGSKTRLCLFDRFHEKNTVSEVEILRRITFIPQLHGILNTQVEEQLHLRYDSDKRFLNRMLPVHHIFLFRSILNYHNINKNSKVIKRLQKQTNFATSEDSFGRTVFVNIDSSFSHLLKKSDKSIRLCTEQEVYSDCSEYNADMSFDEEDQDTGNENKNTADDSFGPISENKDSDIEDNREHLTRGNKDKYVETAVNLQSGKNVEMESTDSLVQEQKASCDNNSDDSNGVCFNESNANTHQVDLSTGIDSIDNIDVVNNVDSVESVNNLNYGDTNQEALITRKRKAKKSCDCCRAYGCKNEEQESLQLKPKKIARNVVQNINQMWLPGHNLTEKDKHAILSGCKLTDNVINAGLKITFNSKTRNWQGLFNVVDRKKYSVPGYKKTFEYAFIQVVKLYESHYVTVSDMPWPEYVSYKARAIYSSRQIDKQHKIFIYDCNRVISYRSKRNELKYPMSLLQDCAEIFQNNYKDLIFSVEDAVQVKRSADSGIFAIILAFNMAQGVDPLSISIDDTNLRDSFVTFLETGKFLPGTVTLVDNSLLPREYTTWSEIVYCHCRQPDYGERMKSCDCCGEWYHEWCEDFSNSNSDTWLCNSCRGINALPVETLAFIFKEICVENETMTNVLSCVCKKWASIISPGFNKLVHFTWMDRMFKVHTWTDAKREKDRVMFDIIKCPKCDRLFKPQIGYYRKPGCRSTCIYPDDCRISGYCCECEPIMVDMDWDSPWES